MGCHENITFDKFPKQGPNLGKLVEVIFHYDTSKKIKGRIVRDDYEEPGRTIIALDDGRYVEAVECQYTILHIRKLREAVRSGQAIPSIGHIQFGSRR